MDRFNFLLYSLVIYFFGVIFSKKTKSAVSWVLDRLKGPVEMVKSWGDVVFALITLTFLGNLAYQWWPLNNDESQVLIFSVTAATLFFQAIVGNKSYKYRNKPVIELNFDDSDSVYFHKTKMRIQTDILSQQESSTNVKRLIVYVQTYYARLKIINSGNTTLKNTEVIIEKVEPLNGTELIRPFMPLNLHWAFAEEKEKRKISIPPHNSYRIVDFLELTEPESTYNYTKQLNEEDVDYERYKALISGFRICSVPPNTLSDIFEKGSYIFRIGIYSSNSKPLYKKFSVEYDGQWSNDISEMSSNHFKVKMFN